MKNGKEVWVNERKVYRPESKRLETASHEEISRNPGYAVSSERRAEPSPYHATLRLLSPSNVLLKTRCIIGFPNAPEFFEEYHRQLKELSTIAKELSNQENQC